MNRRHKIIWSVVLAGMLGLLTLGIFGDNGFVELKRLEATQKDLLKQNALLTQINSRMYATIDRLQNDPVCIENIARQELGMIRSDELIFKFKSKPKIRQ